MRHTERPDHCPKCGAQTTLVAVTRLSPRMLLESCHVCGCGLALVRRPTMSPEGPPESPRIAAGHAPVVRVADRLVAVSGGHIPDPPESHRGPLVPDGPRRPFGDLIEALGRPVGPGYGPFGRGTAPSGWV